MTLLAIGWLNASEPIVWDFDTGMDGWHDLGEGRDVKASWDNGSLRMDYYDGTPDHSNENEQLWFAGIQVEHKFIAEEYPYLELYYSPENWPTEEPIKILLQFEKADGNLSYAYVDLDPKKSFVSVDIAANDPSWGKPYVGEMKTVHIELPHNGAALSKPAINWFESSTLIHKVVLTDTPTQASMVSELTFDGGIEDALGNVSSALKGGAAITAAAAKFGMGGLELDGTGYLEMAANDVFRSDNISFLMWVKTTSSPEGVSKLLSTAKEYGFDLAINEGKLCFYNGAWTPVNISWKNEEWQRIGVIVEGSIVKIYVNGQLAGEMECRNMDRTGDFYLGGTPEGSIKGYVDEFSVYNYALTEQELLRDYETLPPTGVVWPFDDDFCNTTGEYEAAAVGSPVIDSSEAKVGSGSLKTSAGNYLELKENPITNSSQISYSMWVKVVETSASPAYLLSYGTGKFDLAIKDGSLCYRNSTGEWTVMREGWQYNVWQKVTLVVTGNNVMCYVNGTKTGFTPALKEDLRTGALFIGKDLPAYIDDLVIYNYALSDKDISGDDFVAPNMVDAWSFDKDLEGWYIVDDGNKRDVELSWDNGSMVLTYADNAKDQGPQLWFPNVEVKTKFDSGLYPYCDIHYEAVGWPTDQPVKALLEFTRTDNKIAYAFFDLDPKQKHVRVNIPASDPTWGAKYEGEINSVRLEIPHNSSANPAEPWFGASTRVDKVQFNDGMHSVDEGWSSTLSESDFEKNGMDRFNSPTFQYYTIGLGGTTLRVDPWGFAYDRAPATSQDSRNHKPAFGYEYWWDNAGHRLNPFIVKGGYYVDEGRYGVKFRTGTITSYNQKLDIMTGVVTTTLGLKVGDTEFKSVRETFVTPEGVLVIRVKDEGAPSPVNLHVDVNEVVEFLGTYYEGEEEPFVKDSENTKTFGTNGAYITAKRSNTSLSTVAVSVDASSDVVISEDCEIFSQSSPDGVITFYISPKSSFCPETPATPWSFAETAASESAGKGYDALLSETGKWWNDYMNVSKVSVPDKTVSRLYAQSLFYHGVYFGNGSIPPGCFGTDIFGFFGGICPEYDLTFSSFAMAYTGHISETKNIADWVYSALPKCKEQATQGIQHHDVFRKYDKGAIYTTIMGYDGTMTVQPEPQEGINLLQNYPGLNSARMALNYLDYSDDESFKDAAHDILKSTTYIALQDLIDNGNGGYRDGKIPNCMQEGAVLMGFDQCVKRGIADREWIDKYSGKIEYPAGELNGKPILSGGCGYNPAVGEGGSTWTYPLWWATVVDKEDPMAVNYVENCEGTFESYCFNNGWNGVANAKIFRGNNALMWLRNFERPEVLLDETSFSENASSAGINYTPEVGAHGVYVCNVTQMLIDPDRDNIVDIFPAIPDEWEYKTVGFDNLMATGALSFTARRDINGMSVSVENRANAERSRKIRIKTPRMLKTKSMDGMEYEEENGFIVFDVTLKAGEKKDYSFVFYTSDAPSVVDGIEAVQTHFVVYPNPNTDNILKVSNHSKVDMLEIYSISGQFVKRFEGENPTYDISDLDNGLYIVSIISEGERHSYRLVVK